MLQFYPAILLLSILIASTGLHAQVDWTPYNENPIIDATFDPESDVTFRPSVLFHDGLYHMWYGKASADGTEKMGYATSTDGISWTLVKATVLSPSLSLNGFDNLDASQGWVIEDADTFKMWYWGNSPSAGRIGYAWSVDGTNWTKVLGAGTGGSVLDQTMDGSGAIALVTPCVLKDNDTYHMWYGRVLNEGIRTIFNIAYATSPDGIEWTNQPKPGSAKGTVIDIGSTGAFDAEAASWPAVIKTDDGFMMWYTGVDASNTLRVGCATSTDGLNWTKIEGNQTAGACYDAADFVSVIKQDDTYKMWYGIDFQDVVHYATSGPSTGVAESNGSTTTQGARLIQSVPNPTSNATTLIFFLPKADNVQITLYDMLGRQQQELTSNHYSAGMHRLEWDAKNVAEGTYFYRLQVGHTTTTKKIHVLR